MTDKIEALNVQPAVLAKSKYRFGPDLEEHIREIVREEIEAFLKSDKGSEVLDEVLADELSR